MCKLNIYEYDFVSTLKTSEVMYIWCLIYAEQWILIQARSSSFFYFNKNIIYFLKNKYHLYIQYLMPSHPLEKNDFDLVGLCISSNRTSLSVFH